MFAKIQNFISEVKNELIKVSWSTRQELIGATTVVIVVTFALALFIGGVDFVLSKVLRAVIK